MTGIAIQTLVICTPDMHFCNLFGSVLILFVLYSQHHCEI